MDLDSRVILSRESRAGWFRAARLFGSRAKGTATPDSDHDVLILTSSGGEGSWMEYLEGFEVHASYYPLAGMQKKIPPKWWEPLATSVAIPLGRDDDEGERLAERARGFWADETARAREADLSSRRIVADLEGAPPRPASLKMWPQLRARVDAAVGVACFRDGKAEPSKRARISGARAALSLPDPAVEALLGALALADPPPEAGLRDMAAARWEEYTAWVEKKAITPWHLAVLGGPNRWERDTARAAAAGEHADVGFLLGFALDRVVLDEPKSPQGEPWFEALWDARHPGESVESWQARLASARALIRALGLGKKP